MSTLAYIIVFSLIGSVFSLIGGVLLLARVNIAQRLSHLLAAFAAGALLGTTFFDLLPEALEESHGHDVLFWTLCGILLFFLLERFVHWFHHHGIHHRHTEQLKPAAALIVLGDTLHNLIDGVIIASTFLVDIRLGIITSLAVAAHEIPQEIGDFGVLLHMGWRRRRVLGFNLVSALATLVGAVLTYFIGHQIESLLPVFLATTGGFFIYIAASDLIPEMHNQKERGLAALQSLLLLVGVAVIWLTVQLLAV